MSYGLYRRHRTESGYEGAVLGEKIREARVKLIKARLGMH